MIASCEPVTTVAVAGGSQVAIFVGPRGVPSRADIVLAERSRQLIRGFVLVSAETEICTPRP
jgi:hypothetical protein